MAPDLHAATSFLATSGRQLDRRRLELLLDRGTDRTGVIAALDAYRNPDGGYGWGLEPDLRAAESQPTAAMHAFEVLAELGPTTSPHATALCDWLEGVTLPDGGLPFALPAGDPTGCAPWWVGADPDTSTLQMTAQVAAQAHLVAGHDEGVAGHPWLATATRWCLDTIEALVGPPPAYELLFALRFLDAVHDRVPEAPALLERLVEQVPASGSIPVEGGAEGECVRPLDLAPAADRPLRRLLALDVVTADLERLAAGQQADGGWTVDFPSSSPAGALDWRGYATVVSVRILLGG